MSSATDKYAEQLLSMKVGDSFFVEGVRPAELGSVRRLAYTLGIKLTIRFVLSDPIYGKSGTRVKRVKSEHKAS